MYIPKYDGHCLFSHFDRETEINKNVFGISKLKIVRLCYFLCVSVMSQLLKLNFTNKNNIQKKIYNKFSIFK